MFKIGQQVICIKSHSEGLYIKDKVYTIKGIYKGCCGINLDLGLPNNPGRCGSFCFCGNIASFTKFLCSSDNFTPIQSQYKSISYSKILEEIEVCEN